MTEFAVYESLRELTLNKKDEDLTNVLTLTDLQDYLEGNAILSKPINLRTRYFWQKMGTRRTITAPHLPSALGP